MMTSTASARPLDAPLGTGFTYQGKLSDGGAPANGEYDLQFTLYDALSSGSSVGGTVTLDDVSVTNGLFTVQLDFGAVFNGAALYLEIGVRPGASTGAYTALTPRQPLTAAPYAIYAASAPWSGLTGVPAGFADGVDNGSAYQNVKVVAKSGGDFTTITAALDSITDASASNPYLVYVAPGVYTERVIMKQYVDIEGAGELTTTITFTGAAAADTGTVVGANNAELRFLTVESTGGSYPIAIYDNSASPRLTHITAISSLGGHNYSIYNYSSSSPTMTHVTASASGGIYQNNGVYNFNTSSPIMTDVNINSMGGTNSYGVFNQNQSLPAMTNVYVSASEGTNASIGVYNINNSPKLQLMTNVTATASGATNNYGVYNAQSSPIMTNVIATASGGTNNCGIYTQDFSSPKMTYVIASASGGTNAYGVYNSNLQGTQVINNSTIGASGGTNNYGLYNSLTGAGGSSILVNASQVIGSTNTITNVALYNTLLGASFLSGGPISNSGTLICAGVYDENYTFYASTCP
jgi:pectin methylesterase-like acyl-CoA thioesterase